MGLKLLKIQQGRVDLSYKTLDYRVFDLYVFFFGGGVVLLLYRPMCQPTIQLLGLRSLLYGGPILSFPSQMSHIECLRWPRWVGPFMQVCALHFCCSSMDYNHPLKKGEKKRVKGRWVGPLCKLLYFILFFALQWFTIIQPLFCFKYIIKAFHLL